MRVRCMVLFVMAVVLVAPQAGWCGFAGTEVYLPSVGLGPGYQGSQWHTTVWIRNPESSDAKVDLEFLERGTSNPAPLKAQLVVAAGETIKILDVLRDLFALSKGYGAIRIVSDRKILVASRAFSQPAGAGEDATTGQFFGAVPASFAIGQGEETSVVGAFQMTPMDAGPFRYNYGFVEATGNNATIRVTAYDGFDPTTPLGSKDYTVGGHGAIQENLSKLISNPNGDNIWLKFEVLSGPGKIIAFGTGVANGSNDPSTFEMQFADSLLGGGGGSGGGLDKVSHDSTLTGDGTQGSPLGVADGAITTAKLSATGSSAGQILSSDGSKVVWTTPSGSGGGGSLSFPFSGSAAMNETLFVIHNTGSGRAIYGQSDQHDGLTGKTGGATRSGVYGSSSTKDGYGVFGRNYGNGATGYLGGSDGSISTGAYGSTTQEDGTGVKGEANKGIKARGVWGLANEGYGVWGESVNGWAIYGKSTKGWAGVFDGDVLVNGNLDVQGTVSKFGGSFKIDDPLDPANKYLYHSFVESPDMMNVYNGNVVLDGKGEAVVELPAYFQALNGDFRYQLTCIGGFAPVYVAEKISGNRFKIAGGSPGLEVSWQVTGIRHDPWAEAHRIPVEVEKPEAERGSYLAPELYGRPASESLAARTMNPHLSHPGIGPSGP